MNKNIQIFGANREIYEVCNNMKHNGIVIIYGKNKKVLELSDMDEQLWNSGKIRLEISKPINYMFFHELVKALSDYSCFVVEEHIKSTYCACGGEYYSR